MSHALTTTHLRLLALLTRLVILSLSVTLLSPASAKAEVVQIGYVSGGLYEQFVTQKLVELEIEGTALEFVETQGSRDQMEKLSAGEIDLAIVQSDIAYYVHEGIRGYERYADFALVLPLFEEYVQVIVNADSDIFTLGRLLNGTVSVGERGSGTYQNAMDLFEQLGFRDGIDFQLAHLPIEQALRMLQNNEIDGAIYTGGVFPSSDSINPENFRVLAVPDGVLEALTIRSSYYSKSQFSPRGSANTNSVNTASIQAAFVAANDVDQDLLIELIGSITATSESFLANDGSLIALRTPDSAIARTAIPLHAGLRDYLVREGFIGRDYSLPLIFLVVLSLIAFVASVKIRMRTYDRMGNLTASRGTITYSLYQGIAKSGTSLIVLFIFFLLLVAFVESIQYFESEYARRLNVRNPFADRGFWNSLLWVVTFMGAGDPGDVFPNSDGGKFLASILPFLGIGAVLGFGYSALEQRREKRLQDREGSLIRTVRDHVLICGWNEKAPGIIYTLTSTDVPRKRHVVVVAEMDGRTPLDRYNFDLRYVCYCRGDSADHKALERANAKFADSAIVLGGVKKRSARNIKSVLSVLALKELSIRNEERKDDTLVIAELMFSENAQLFETCGADSIVSSQAITDRVATMSCVSPLVIDFVLDMLTYDDRSELYALSVADAREILQIPEEQPISLSEAAAELLPLGINTVSTNNKLYEDAAFLDHFFTGEKFDLRLTAGESALTDDRELLVIADDYKEVKKLSRKSRAPRQPLEIGKPSIRGPKAKNIILVGHQDRCLSIAEHLSHFSPVNTTIVATNRGAVEKEGIIVGDFSDEAVWVRAGIHSADQITILAKDHGDINAATEIDVNEMDAKALLIAKFARSFGKEYGENGDPVIVAEMLSATNQQLFTDAGADIVIPADRILERVISKLIYSRGAVTRFLMALLRFDDGKHFCTFKLEDPGECRSFEDLFSSMPDYFQLLGVLPSNETEREKWLNKVQDFNYHFLTIPTQEGASSYVPQPGDALVGIVDQESWLESTVGE